MLKIATWNVNSIRVRAPTVLEWLHQEQPDVLCLQETKVEDDAFPSDAFFQAGYYATLYGQKQYNGVAILSKHPVTDIQVGWAPMRKEALGPSVDNAYRLVAATTGGVRVMSVYVPNGESPASPKLAYKMAFMKQLRLYLDQCADPSLPCALVGDFNIAMEGRDVYSTEAMEGEVAFLPEERAALADLQAWGLHDLFRKYHTGPGLFSWWDYRMGSFRRNIGLRIDYIFTTASLTARANGCHIDTAPRQATQPSDHAPVVATFSE